MLPKPDVGLIGTLLQAHYKATADLAGQYATKRVIAALMAPHRAAEAAPVSGEAFTVPWSTPARVAALRKTLGLGPRTGPQPPNADQKLTLQERLGLGQEWNKHLGEFGFHLRDPELLAQMNRRGTLIKGDVSATMLQDLHDVLSQQFYKEGQSPKQVAKDIERIFPHTYWGRAQTIARSETGFAQGLVQHEAYTRDGVPYKQWHTSMRNSRDTHVTANGQTQAMDRPYIVGGVAMMYPHAEGAPAKEVVNCQCDSMPQYPADLAGLPAKPWLGEATGD